MTTRYRITDPLLFWLPHLVLVPAVFLAAFFGPMLYQAFAAGDLRSDTWGLMMGLGYALGGYAIGALATAAYAFGLVLWQRLRGSPKLTTVLLAPVLICGGILLLAGSQAIARGRGADLLPGGRDFGVTLVFLLTALAFIAVFFLCLRLGIVERRANG